MDAGIVQGVDLLAQLHQHHRRTLGIGPGRLAGLEIVECQHGHVVIRAVPAGLYAKAALEKLGAWAAVQDRLAQAENVRATLAFVARGETPLGIVYATDAKIEPGVKIVGTFPADSHPPIVYPVAAVAGHESEKVTRYLQFLRGSEASTITK